MTDFVTVKFSFIRHGESIDNLRSVWAGWQDSKLSNHGKRQAEALAKSFANTNLTVIHSSPLERALLTAKALQAAQPNFVPLQISPLLREQNFGRGEGQKYDVRKKPHLSFKEHVAQGIYITPFNRSDRYPDGESLDDVAKRADNVVENIILPYVEKATREGNQNMHIAFVSHGIFIAELIASLAAQSGSRPRPSQFRGLRNTGYTRVVVKAVRDEGDAQDVHLPVVEVTQHNLCTHLDGLVGRCEILYMKLREQVIFRFDKKAASAGQFTILDKRTSGPTSNLLPERPVSKRGFVSFICEPSVFIEVLETTA